MATPQIHTDGSTDMEEAVFNQYLSAGGNAKVNVKMVYAHIRFNGASLEVVSTTDSSQIVTGDLTFNGGNTSVEITLAGYVNPPLVIASPNSAVLTAHGVKGTASSNVLAEITFYDEPSNQITTGSLDTNMNFNVLIIGF
jgi:hypothetical protein